MNLKILIILFLSIISVAFAIIVFPWLMLFIGGLSTNDPSTPQVTYGEFPFRLEYEINGENFVVEDTVVCEYDGVGWNEGQGKFRKWRGYLAATGENSLLLMMIDDTRKIYCSVGSAKYYMDDEEEYVLRTPFTPHAYIVESNGNHRLLPPEELLDEYNISLISWSFTEPIINNFISP